MSELPDQRFVPPPTTEALALFAEYAAYRATLGEPDPKSVQAVRRDCKRCSEVDGIEALPSVDDPALRELASVGDCKSVGHLAKWLEANAELVRELKRLPAPAGPLTL